MPACSFATFPPVQFLSSSPLHRHTFPSGSALDIFVAGTGTVNGQHNSYTKGTCDVCVPGEFLNSDTQMCESCPNGKYTDDEGLTVCSSCPAGSFDSAAGGSTSSECTLCAAGTFNEVPGRTVCDDCGVGKVSKERPQRS